jgi:hypothetical protein
MVVNHYYGPIHVMSLQQNLTPQQCLALPLTANASLMLQNKDLLSKVADLQTALVKHKPVPQQPLALPSNVDVSPTPQENELQSKVSDLEAALQKAEQEASSAKTELLKMQANLVKANEQAANAPGLSNYDVTVRAKLLVDRK